MFAVILGSEVVSLCLRTCMCVCAYTYAQIFLVWHDCFSEFNLLELRTVGIVKIEL